MREVSATHPQASAPRPAGPAPGLTSLQRRRPAQFGVRSRSRGTQRGSGIDGTVPRSVARGP